jgi:uncharacterized protein (TIGR00297 family)
VNPLLALGIAAIVAGLGRRARALSGDGSIAATAVGTSILAFAGWPGLAVLGVFFLGSTAVSRLASAAAPRSDQADTEVRDWRQVLANGGAAMVGATGELLRPGLGLWLVSVSLAAAAADTWATAFGGMSRTPPRDVLRRIPVPAGTSGGVTWFGMVGGLMGATLVGLVAASMGRSGPLYLASTAIGFVSMLVDSMLGSAGQARFHCSACDLPTERRVHRCGHRTEWRRGWRWLDNNGVNAVATGFALLVGLVAWFW